MQSVRNSSLIAAATLSISVVVDQLSKNWIRTTLAPGESFPLFGPVTITHVQNTGSVFGLGQGLVLIPTVASIIVIALIPITLHHLYSRHKVWPTTLEMLCVGLVAGGALGNLVDRIALGHVTDFVYVLLPGGVYWPAFNVADACIVVATIALLFLLVRRGVFDDAEGTTSI